MKSIRRILCLTLAVLIIFSMTACEGIEQMIKKLSSPNQGEEQIVVDNTLGGYLIVRSDSADNDVLEISSEIRSALEKLGYADAQVKTDYAFKDNPPAKEILVGATNRTESIDISDFSDKDFAVRGEGHKILLAAKNTASLQKAAEYLINDIFPLIHSGKLMAYQVDYIYRHEFNVKNVLLGDVSIDKCELVIGEDVTLTERKILDDFLENVYKVSGKRFGASLADGENAGAYLYYNGKTDEIVAIKNSLSKDAYSCKIASDGKSLIVASNARYGLINAVNDLAKNLFDGFSEDFVSAGINLSGEKATQISGESVHEIVISKAAQALSASLVASSKTSVLGLRVDGLENPLGLDNGTPVFSWYMDSPEYNESQISYRIGVASSAEKLAGGEYDIWDSNSILTKQNTASLPMTEKEDDENDNKDGEKTLVSRLEASTRYYWNVTLHTNRGHSVTSAPAWFETGLMENALEDASWICADDYYCTSKVGTVEAKFKLTKNAAGVSFGFSESEDFYYMWQFNISNYGYGVLRPHVFKDGAWSYLPEVSLKEIFPTAESAYQNHILMKISINDGIISTSINDKLVSTNNVEPFALGNVKQRLSGGESAEYEYIRLVDDSGAILSEGKDKTSAPIYRHDFLVDNPENIVSARLYASALGAYEVSLNGKKFGSSMLNPGRTAYNDKIYYQTYDVTDLITSTNAISAVVGDGWYNSKIVGGSYGEKNAFIAKLLIKLNDGTTRKVLTGEGWQFTHGGPVTYADFYDGQGYDARLEIPGESVYAGVKNWNNAQVLSEADEGILMTGVYRPGTLVAEAMEPVRIISQIKPIGVTNPVENVFVYDFGQNIAGTVSIKATADEGTQMTVNYSERLVSEPPYVLDMEYMLGNNGKDTYIFKGAPDGEEFMPTLVYHGFRYIQIEGLSEALPFENLTAFVLSSDLERTGSFESGNDLLNRYYNNTIRSQQSNFISNLTNCPTGEKNGSTGDAQIFAKTGSFNMNVTSIYKNFMEMMRASLSTDGAVPEILPSRGTSNTTKTPAGWSDAVITIPYELYLQYGDKILLSDNYAAMKGWIDYLLKYKFAPDKDDYIRDDGNYGDHLAYFNNQSGIGYPEKEYNGSSAHVQRETTYSEIGTAYSAYSTALLSKIAAILGNADDAAYYADLSGKFAHAWRTNFLMTDGFTPKSNSQTSFVMGLYFDLYDSAENKSSAFAALCKDIEEKGYQTVGFIGISYIYDVLSNNGRADLAYKLLLNTEKPSLLYPVTMDATTTWESYNGGSFNHYVQGSPVRWLYTDVLGIDHDYIAENAGYKSFNLSPIIYPELGYAKGAYVSANGVIKSAWEALPDGSYTYFCTVPANTSATLTLPVSDGQTVTVTQGKDYAQQIPANSGERKSSFKLLSGSYSFSVK